MAKTKPEFTISLIALAFSIVATISSIYFSRINLKTGVLPTLIFVYDSKIGWSLKNVGNGPALNVEVAHQDEGVKKWKDPTLLYPISEDGSVNIKWVGHSPNKLIAAYTDVHNREYKSVTDDDRTTINDREKSRPWTRDEVKRIWERQ